MKRVIKGTTIDLRNIKVEYVAHMGSDRMPVNAAKISRGNESKRAMKTSGKDIHLMDFLAKHDHMTPFEHQALCVIVHCPLYIRSQIHRHRTFSYNEISRRYTSEALSYYVPKNFHMQGLVDKQKSGQKHMKGPNEFLRERMIRDIAKNQTQYEYMLSRDVAREEARAVLPQSLMTKFYMTGNLRNWIHFLGLRLDDHAQFENQLVAKGVLKIAKKLWPESTRVMMSYTKVGNAKVVNQILSGDL